MRNRKIVHSFCCAFEHGFFIQRVYLFFLKHIINLTVRFIWSLKTKWCPLDVSRFRNTGCEAVCKDALLKLFFLLLQCLQSFCPLSAVHALYSPGCYNKSIYFVSTTARHKQENKRLLRESVGLGDLYSVDPGARSYTALDQRCSWGEKNEMERTIKTCCNRKRMQF